MLNRIWFWLLLIGIVYGFGKAALRPIDLAAMNATENSPADPSANTDSDNAPTADSVDSAPVTRMDARLKSLNDAGQGLTNAALGAAKSTVQLCIGLIGIMALWLGMLNIAKEAGMVDALATALRPLVRWLFPEVPDGHPAQGAMLMNIAANMLGLGNSATPFGLKAMRELQTLNPTEDTATNAMATFLAINTSSVTLIPITVIGLRLAANSNNAAEPLFVIILTTTVTTITAIIAVRLLSRLPRFAVHPVEPPATPSATDAT